MKHLETYEKYIQTNFDNHTNYYYLVIRCDEKNLENVSTGVLPNLKGISDDINIIDSFFDIRELLIIMPKHDTDIINRLEKVDYDNIDYLCENNLSILRRLYASSEDSPNESLIYQMFRRQALLKHRFYQSTACSKLIQLNKKYENGREFKSILNYLDLNCHRIFDKVKDIKDFNDLLGKTNVIIMNEKVDIKIDTLKNVLEFIILNFSNMFKREGEILVKSEEFIIPTTAKFLFKETVSELVMNRLRKYFDIISKKWKCKWIKEKFVNSKHVGHKQTFATVRYLDKLFK